MYREYTERLKDGIEVSNNNIPVILDVETFRYDLLVGIKDLKDNSFKFYWNNDIKAALDDIRENNRPVITYNGEHYDLPLLYNYFYNKTNKATFFELSKFIVEDQLELYIPKDFFYSIDVMAALQTRQSLKLIEAILGWEIRETTIDFNYEFKLREDQRREVEHYNIQDLEASHALYNKMSSYFNLRIRLAEYLGMKHDYRIPLPTMMGIGLNAHRERHESLPIHQDIYNLPIKHEVKDVMIKHMEGKKSGLSYNFEINGVPYTVGDGGIHSNLYKVDESDVWHIDVKGYYTLIQILFNLFSRNIPDKDTAKVIKMYFERLKLNGSDFSNMTKKLYDIISTKYPDILKFIFEEDLEKDKVTANSLKLGILSIWGAMRNYAHILHDYDAGFLVTLYGQINLIYLIELLSGDKCDVLNANTDGIIVKGDVEFIRSKVKEWQDYTGFDVEVVNYKRFVAKDINNYIMGNSIDKLTTKGRNFTALRDWLFTNIVLIPQAAVISKLLTELLFNGEAHNDPEQYVRDRVKNYTPQDYMFIANHTMRYQGMFFAETGERMQRTNRVYAHKEGNTVYKFKGEFSKHNMIFVSEVVEYQNPKRDVLSKKTIKGYIRETNLKMFNSAVGLDKEQYLESLPKTSDGKDLMFRYGEEQFKYPGLPLVKMCNDHVDTYRIEVMDINYDYYIDEIMKVYVTYV